MRLLASGASVRGPAHQQDDSPNQDALAVSGNRSSHAQSRFTGREVAPLTYEETLDNIQYALGFTEFFKEWM
ncbi:hypothetical protein L5554_001505 [Pseudomonas aeruginosa]|nr:hypothetical protein [Pseudomonas aeruginosa]